MRIVSLMPVILTWHIVQKDSRLGLNDVILVAMTTLDQIDRTLIAHLAQNARAPVAKLAQRMGLARTTVQARLDRLERTGVIGLHPAPIG